MAANDDCGMHVLRACRDVGAVVPDQVAVIGVDNDEFLCGLSSPPLTSIELGCEEIGYEAAAVLERLMRGEKVPRRLAPVKPRRVVCRQSTDILAVDDEESARAIHYIRTHACARIRVRDVCNHVGASRARLEPTLRRILGRTIHKEIQRVRIERAKELLRSSGMTIKLIARASGFRTVQYMTRLFRSVTGTTPARFRGGADGSHGGR
jgi:LacI family transcriptional regulator